MLSDSDNALARSLGLTFRLSDELRRIYEGFGIDLPALHGSESWELPLPTRLVLDHDGVVVRVDADPDYTRRPDPAETLEVLRGLG